MYIQGVRIGLVAALKNTVTANIILYFDIALYITHFYFQ